MKYLVSELVGALLDAAVAKADGLEPRIEPYRVTGGYGITFVRDEPVCVVRAEHFSPSSDWAHGGPIIDRESIDVHKVNDSHFGARLWVRVDDDTITNRDSSGPTRLIAAMRAFVIARLGDEIEL